VGLANGSALVLHIGAQHLGRHLIFQLDQPSLILISKEKTNHGISEDTPIKIAENSA